MLPMPLMPIDAAPLRLRADDDAIEMLFAMLRA